MCTDGPAWGRRRVRQGSGSRSCLALPVFAAEPPALTELCAVGLTVPSRQLSAERSDRRPGSWRCWVLCDRGKLPSFSGPPFPPLKSHWWAQVVFVVPCSSQVDVRLPR